MPCITKTYDSGERSEPLLHRVLRKVQLERSAGCCLTAQPSRGALFPYTLSFYI